MVAPASQTVAWKGKSSTKSVWNKVNREDIYRQRIFGNDAGTRNFTDRSEEVKHTCFSLLVYIVFIALTLQFCQDRANQEMVHHVNAAIHGAINRSIFQTEPTVKYWDDIHSQADLKLWLTNAFPDLVMPGIQLFNKPTTNFRFTLRRIQTEASTDKRFGFLAEDVWVDHGGILPTQIKNHTDQTVAYGVYREWGMSKLNWNSEFNEGCTSGELIDLLKFIGKTEGVALDMCKSWCELLLGSKPCRCFTFSGKYSCHFYHVPESVLSEGSHSLLPPTKSQVGVSAYYPTMKDFNYDESPQGYYGTTGYVIWGKYYFMKNILSEDVHYPLTPARVLRVQIQDWMLGGFLVRDATALSVDFITYNAEYKMFSWVQLTFHMQASGWVETSKRVDSIQIPNDSIVEPEGGISSTLSSPADVIYLLFVAVYLCRKMFPVFSLTLYRFFEVQNLFSFGALCLHLATMALWFNYASITDFTGFLSENNEDVWMDEDYSLLPDDAFTKFHAQVDAYKAFLRVSSFTVLVLFLEFLQYLRDVFPRVAVLLRTITIALAPIISLLIIVITAFFGFVFWAYVMFGGYVESYSTFGEATFSCVAILFGNMTEFVSLKDEYPIASGIFFLVYITIFLFVFVNLSKAILIASYKDATIEFQKLQANLKEAAENCDGNESSHLTRYFQNAKETVGTLFVGWEEIDAHLEKKRRRKLKKWTILAYLSFVACYLAMTFLMTQVTIANAMQNTIVEAINYPTYNRILDGTAETVMGNSFGDIGSIEDVRSFLTDALPLMMFGSSEGTFDSVVNPLKTYYGAFPAQYTQLVINNWNILVGQQPLRMTVRFFEMEDFGEEITYVKRGSEKVRKYDTPTNPTRFSRNGLSWVYPFNEDVGSASNRTATITTAGVMLRKYCNYSSEVPGRGAETYGDEVGFVCLLNVDQPTTENMLKDMFLFNNIIDAQTASLAVDFVVYNGYADSFAYVAMIFVFTPSGEVESSVIVETVRLELYKTGLDYVRLLLEVSVMIVNIVYFVGTIKELCDVLANKAVHRTCGTKFLWTLEGSFRFFVLNPFRFLDLVSTVFIFVMMIEWYSLVFSPLITSYNFPETPVWSSGTCLPEWTWCSDADVIHEFELVAASVRGFIRTCSVSTVLLFFRLIYYFKVFPQMRAIDRTLYNGAVDTIWFVVVSVIILLAFVMMGHQAFGAHLANFQTIGIGARNCFEMFLGNFNYSVLVSADPIIAPIFFFGYMIIFKFVLVNMFIAIISLNFHVQEKQLLKELQEEYAHGQEKKRLREDASWLSVRYWRKVLFEEEEDIIGQPITNEAETVDMTDVAEFAGQTDVAEIADQNPEVQATLDTLSISEQRIKMENWSKLPDHMKKWAVDTAERAAHQVEEFHVKKHNVKEVVELDGCLQDAETFFKTMMNDAKEKAREEKNSLVTGELRKLQQVHQDQETLAWTIMKQEADYKELDASKREKEQHLNELMGVVTELVKSDE